jgi:hypothetical protein
VNAEWHWQLARHWALAALYARARARNGAAAPWANEDRQQLSLHWRGDIQ